MSSAQVTITTPDPLLMQLKRIEGQLTGVIKMYSDDRTCIDVVHQIVAVRNSLGKVARELLTSEASRCSRERKLEDFDKILKELLR